MKDVNDLQFEFLNDQQLKRNGSYVVYKNAAGECVKVEKTIGGTTFTKLINRTDNVAATQVTISEWS